jgi:hypothetical protein
MPERNRRPPTHRRGTGARYALLSDDQNLRKREATCDQQVRSRTRSGSLEAAAARTRTPLKATRRFGEEGTILIRFCRTKQHSRLVDEL